MLVPVRMSSKPQARPFTMGVDKPPASSRVFMPDVSKMILGNTEPLF